MIVGQRLYLCAAKTKPPAPIWSAALQGGELPAWMIERVKQVGAIEADTDLPTSVIVGTTVIEIVIPPDSTDVKADRAARNMSDYGKLEELESVYGVPLIAISHHTQDNPAGRMVRRMLASIASFFTGRLM